VQNSRYGHSGAVDAVDEGVGELLEDAFPCVAFTGAEFKAEFSNTTGLPEDGVHSLVGQAFAGFFQVVFFDLVQVAQSTP